MSTSSFKLTAKATVRWDMPPPNKVLLFSGGEGSVMGQRTRRQCVRMKALKISRSKRKEEKWRDTYKCRD